MRWSENVSKKPPVRIAAEDFNPNERAYPYADSPGPDGDSFIMVSDHGVAFIGQRGPIKEHGVNGCQVDDILTFALGTLQTFNKKFPCRENSIAITKIEEALHWLDARKRDREQRNVEGFDKE
jgi:hypothetical protein